MQEQTHFPLAILLSRVVPWHPPWFGMPAVNVDAQLVGVRDRQRAPSPMLPTQVQVSEWPHSRLALLSTHSHLPIRSGTPAAAAGFDEFAGAPASFEAAGDVLPGAGRAALGLGLGPAAFRSAGWGDTVVVAMLMAALADVAAIAGAALVAEAATVGAPRT